MTTVLTFTFLILSKNQLSGVMKVVSFLIIESGYISCIDACIFRENAETPFSLIAQKRREIGSVEAATSRLAVNMGTRVHNGGLESSPFVPSGS